MNYTFPKELDKKLHLYVINRQRKVRVSLSILKKMAFQALPYCLAQRGRGEIILPTLKSLEITLVSDRVIASLHKQFFDDSSPTDVITFPHGEIIISAETAAANAQKYHHSTTAEIALCIIHGFLHLNGYDDRIPKEASKMAKRQSAILAEIAARQPV